MRLKRKHFAAIGFAMLAVLTQSVSTVAQTAADPRVADLVKDGKVLVFSHLSNTRKMQRDNRRALPLGFHAHFRRASVLVRS
jgi:hypothetical protein